MKKLIIAILFVLSLTGCMVPDDSNTDQSSYDKQTTPTETSYSLMPSAQVFRRTGGNWLDSVGENTTVKINGTTVNGISYSAGAYCADPVDGYTFVNSEMKHFYRALSFTGSITGSFISVTGTIKGLNADKLVWKTTEPVTDGWSQPISSISLTIDDKMDEEYSWDYVPFITLLQKNGDTYDFTFTFDAAITNIKFLRIGLSIYYVNEVTELDAFTITNLKLNYSR